MCATLFTQVVWNQPENLNKHNTYYIDFTVIGTSGKTRWIKIEEEALKFGKVLVLYAKYFGTSEQDGQDVCTDKKITFVH